MRLLQAIGDDRIRHRPHDGIARQQRQSMNDSCRRNKFIGQFETMILAQYRRMIGHCNGDVAHQAHCQQTVRSVT